MLKIAPAGPGVSGHKKILGFPHYVTRIDSLEGLSVEERSGLRKVTEKYPFRSNEYYLSLVDWDREDDPIRGIIVPHLDELKGWGRLDASSEDLYTVAPGCQHKYKCTALLLVSDVCGGFCRYCFRKRLFMESETGEVCRDISQGLEYIEKHKEITNVLLTGGDPLTLPTKKLEQIIRQVREIEHVQIIRIGSKIPAYNPYRILNDPSLALMLKRHSSAHKKIYLMTQFNHPNELTHEAVSAIHSLLKSGVLAANQTPLLRGINDDPHTLSKLFKKLSFIGVPPYYVFICRPTSGNRHFAVPVEQAYTIFHQAQMNCSGLAKRARLAMSHATGKIEVTGMGQGHIYFRYHRAADEDQIGNFVVCKSNPNAFWFDDYEEPASVYSLKNPYRCYGPE